MKEEIVKLIWLYFICIYMETRLFNKVNKAFLNTLYYSILIIIITNLYCLIIKNKFEIYNNEYS